MYPAYIYIVVHICKGSPCTVIQFHEPCSSSKGVRVVYQRKRDMLTSSYCMVVPSSASTVLTSTIRMYVWMYMAGNSEFSKLE